MKIHPCRRCDGCGHIAGGYNWEIPWTRLNAEANVAERDVAEGDIAEGDIDTQPLRARACPDCGGTGALLELASATREPALPTRRGLAQNRYRQHVAGLLRTQAVRGN